MSIYKEVYELSKYSAKDSDYLIKRKVFSEFYKSLKGKQVLVFGGLFKDAHKMYLNGELEVYNYFCDEFRKENIVLAKVHMDETTPHMHLHFIPIRGIVRKIRIYNVKRN